MNDELSLNAERLQALNLSQEASVKNKPVGAWHSFAQNQDQGTSISSQVRGKQPIMAYGTGNIVHEGEDDEIDAATTVPDSAAPESTAGDSQISFVTTKASITSREKVATAPEAT